MPPLALTQASTAASPSFLSGPPPSSPLYLASAARSGSSSSSTAAPQRGQLYRCDLGYGLKPWLVVSDNSSNRVLGDVVAIRITATARDLPTWVRLAPIDPLAGYANADCVEQPRRNLSVPLQVAHQLVSASERPVGAVPGDDDPDLPAAPHPERSATAPSRPRARPPRSARRPPWRPCPASSPPPRSHPPCRHRPPAARPPRRNASARRHLSTQTIQICARQANASHRGGARMAARSLSFAWAPGQDRRHLARPTSVISGSIRRAARHRSWRRSASGCRYRRIPGVSRSPASPP
jgi:mRNA interferase MazF